MECARCHGFMVKERLFDLFENDGQVYVSGWRWAYRCVACGNVSGWVVEQNREMARQTITRDKRTRNTEAGVAGPGVNL
jgi:hypothetical protein